MFKKITCSSCNKYIGNNCIRKLGHLAVKKHVFLKNILAVFQNTSELQIKQKYAPCEYSLSMFAQQIFPSKKSVADIHLAAAVFAAVVGFVRTTFDHLSKCTHYNEYAKLMQKVNYFAHPFEGGFKKVYVQQTFDIHFSFIRFHFFL